MSGALRLVTRTLSCALSCALLCAGTACGGEDRALDGSLSEVLDLTYRKTEVVQTDDELAVRFVMPQGAGEDVVLRVTASLVGTRVDPREPLDLTEEDALGTVRGRVGRSVSGDPLTEFPPLRRGVLTFGQHLEAGARVDGEVRLTFDNGTHLASGRTVFGTFEAQVR